MAKTKDAKKNSIAKLQLKGAECVINYCELVAKEFLNKHQIFDGFVRKYYIIHYANTEKRPLKSVVSPNNSTSENPRNFSGPFVTFRRL